MWRGRPRPRTSKSDPPFALHDTSSHAIPSKVEEPVFFHCLQASAGEPLSQLSSGTNTEIALPAGANVEPALRGRVSLRINRALAPAVAEFLPLYLPEFAGHPPPRRPPAPRELRIDSPAIFSWQNAPAANPTADR